MFAALQAAAGSLAPEIGRGLSTGVALYAANQGSAQCPACTCAPVLQCPELRCDCSGFNGVSSSGPSLWSVALLGGASGLCGALCGAFAGWRAAGGSWALWRAAGPTPDKESELAELARAQARAARVKALQPITA